ncbi:SDR family oxidoreductase [Halobacillus litoralis]|uniref:3-beta hydroxysteroid dehydrogenase n=1 Tax=Halobacillus litoralis TaxID=45668 RepID=A0A410MCK3_9BACI|nr:SDR family oxidoreductase [Halobacillus litoralis]QAS52459.1 3-beta hydroxysteroid dehydrogenase [Halobacillus litoralis]
MKNIYLFTGFPGYLASELVKELFDQPHHIEKIYLLYLEPMEERARDQIKEWEKCTSIDLEKVHLIKGDITELQMGLEPSLSQNLQKSVTHVFHLAALYDLAIPLSAAWKVNVQGTRVVNRWLENCLNLNRYIYFSTAYVSGKREGHISEEDLLHTEGFKNHYEFTKYEAERLVKEVQPHIPTTVIRPGIVVGHTESGITAKFDGPYFILNLLDVLKHSPILPYFGKGEAKVNLVPLDYVIASTIHFAHSPESSGKTYHLTDPNPYTAKAIYQRLCELHVHKKPHLTLPISIARQSLKIKTLRQQLKIQKEALDYFLCQSEYDCTQTMKDLNGTPISCPDLFTYTNNLVSYYQTQKKNPDKHVSIF